jgi:hypothetical protein
MSIGTAALRAGRVTESTAADNATATATVSAIPNQTHLVFGVEAQYSAAVSSIKTVTLKHGSTAWRTWRWDFSNGPFLYNLPVALRSSLNEAVSVELEASGAGGTDGYAVVWTATE